MRKKIAADKKRIELTKKPIEPTVRIGSVGFSDGKSYSIGESDKILLVGPNNAGKSLALKEIGRFIQKSPNSDVEVIDRCVVDLSLVKIGNSSDFAGYLQSNFHRDGEYFQVGVERLSAGFIPWFDYERIGPVGAIFYKHITTENRLEASVDAENVGGGERKTNAHQFMYDSDELSTHMSDLFFEAFGQSLVIDYRGGRTIPIHVGKMPERGPGEERISDSYVAKVRSLPKLSEQGDGMRGYAGILFEGVVNKRGITLVDEPEAFLHPPQMRKLSRTLVNETDGQLFVSTHSADILRGFLDTPSSNVRVIRLQRDGDVNITTETPPGMIRALWENPDLKYSNALDALFHEQCVLCEDDSDCRFYNAILDLIEGKNKGRRIPDTIFVPCGGKHSMAKLGAALKSLGVPVRIIADIDILAEKKTLQNLVEALNGDWRAIEREWRIVDSDVRKGIRPLTPSEMNEQLLDAVRQAPANVVPKSEIRTILQQDSPWSVLKHVGTAALPRGDASTAYSQLEELLAGIGIFVVPVGEVEGFAPSVGLHGPAFVSKVLKTSDLKGEAFESARLFVRKACLSDEWLT